MKRLVQVRGAFRNLRHRPLLAMTIVGTLAVAIAFNVASASVLTALLDHPFPYPALDRLMLVRDARPREGVHQGHAVAAADFFDLRSSIVAFESVAAWKPQALVITSAGADPERVEAAATTANFFSTLGIVPMLGGLWPADADSPGHDAVVLVSRRLWRSRFGGDPSAVGREVSLNGRRAIVVGVVRDEECYPAGIDAWVPLVMTPDERLDRASQRLSAFARLTPGASIAQARAQLESTATLIAARFPLTNQGRGFDLLPLRREQYEFTAALFGFVQAAALLVLALAIVNASNVLVARMLDRRQELAIRSMLGASRGDLSSLILAETAILTISAAGVGVVAALPLLNVIRASLPEGIARWVNGWSAMHVDRGALLAGAVLSLLTAIVLGGIAALSGSKAASTDWIGARATPRRSWGRRAVVAGEVALAAALLVCASVVVQGFGRLATTFTSLAPDRLLRFTLTTPPWRYPNDERVGAFHARMVEAIESLTGVDSVALIRNEPASNVPNPIVTFQRLDEAPRAAAEQPRADVQIVSPRTFDVLRLKTMEGRGFLATDTSRSAAVAIVSREAGRRFWPDRNPIGATFQLDGEPAPRRIVGIVDDLRLNWYDPQRSAVIYEPDAQRPARTVSVLVRTTIDPIAVAKDLRAAIARLDALQPIAELQPLSTSIADSLSPVRVIERLLLAGAIVASALAAVGVFGVLAQSVSRRRRELGVRFALGATRRSIAAMVLGDAMATAAAGLAGGLAVAVPAVRLVRASLLGIAAIDAQAILIVIACTIVVVIGAALGPARRAGRVDVATLLRTE